MFFRRFRQAESLELEQLGTAMGDAVDRFGRELGRYGSRRKAGQSRGSSMPARLSSLPGQRRWFASRWHPARRPLPYRRGVAPTPLTRERDRYGRPRWAVEAEQRAGGIAGWLRLRLLRLRAFLARLRDRFRWGRSRRTGYRMRAARLPIGTGRSGGGDSALTAFVLITTLGLGLELTNGRKAIAMEQPAVEVIEVASPLDARIDELAHAIAVAEGYYADGPHDGRTLPYLLNNPGALKKPTLDAADLPTWKDTGLVWFPTADKGWAALRHQIRLMLTGRSGIYAQSDPLSLVGDKYADGDENWGINVAATLGVPTDRTLAELAPPR